MADHTKSCVVLIFLMMAFLERSMGAVYTVGDSAGWTNTGVDYESWASSHTFKVGDTVVFNYDNESNDVIQVAEENYNSCNSDDNPIESLNSGNDKIEFTDPGTYYYICSFSNRCLNDKQKVEIDVSPSDDTTPSPPDTSPTPPDTSPSPSDTNPTPPDTNPTPSGSNPTPPGTCKSNSTTRTTTSTTTKSAAPGRPFNKHLGGFLVFASCALALYLH